MGIEEYKLHYEEYSKWLLSLKALDDQVWFNAVEEGKWSVSAIVAHLLFWDQYAFDKLFPHFSQGAQLEGFPDFQSFNEKARAYAHSGVTKKSLIDNIVEVRKQYTDYLNQLSDEELRVTFQIGAHSMTINDFIQDFISHDLHHQNQIENVSRQ